MKVRKNAYYIFKPCGWDIADPKTNLKEGDKVQVVALRGCPPPNTMGHCHVNGPDGKFAGLVCTGSLTKPGKPATSS